MSAHGPRPVLVGEVLHDVFPDGRRVLGGAPFNVAWNLRGLGHDPLMITRVGDDERGDEVLAAMRERGLDTAGVQRDPERATGLVRVQLDGAEARYEIPPGQAWDALDADELVDTLARALPPGRSALLYHGSLVLREEPGRLAVTRAAEQLGGARVVDVNLRPPWWDRATLLALLRGARLLKLNEHELHALAGTPDAERADWRARAVDLRARLAVDTLLVTRGERGAWLLDAGERPREIGVLEAPGGRDASAGDTVGAGDAFCAGLLAGVLRGASWDTSLRQAGRLAALVCTVQGATLRDPAAFASLADGWDAGSESAARG